MAFMLERAAKFLSTLQSTLINKSLNFPFPPESLVPALVNLPEYYQQPNTSKPLVDILNDAIFWAVPKKRRSIEKRRTRRFGHDKYFWKMLRPKTNILICSRCKHYYEAGHLCPNCYQEAKKETYLMQNAIIKNLGISPVEKEVVVLYTDDNKDPKMHEGKKIVEMDKPRPKIFSDNLMEKTTQGEAQTKEVAVKPTIDIS